MLPKTQIYFLGCVFLFVFQGINAQSPWVRTKAGAYAQLAYQAIPAYDRLFGASDSDFNIEGGSVTEQGVQLYGEYGLTRNNTLICAIPYRFITAPKRTIGLPNPVYEQTSSTGLGNVSVSLRHGLRNRRITWATTLKVELPTYTNKGEPHRGYTSFTVLPMLNAGMGFERAYWFAYSGYGLRSHQYSHLVDVGAEGGVHLRNFWIIAATQWVKSMKNGQVQLPDPTVNLSLYVNNQEWCSYNFKVIYEHSRFWGVNASFAGAAWAHLVPKSPAWSIGTYFKWD